MSIALLPLTKCDCEEWMRIRKLGYAGPTNRVVHHQPISDKSFARVVEERKKQLHTLGCFHWKVVDVKTEGMMAVAKFSLHNVAECQSPVLDHDDTQSKPPPFVPPEVNIPALLALLKPHDEARQDVMGDRPCLMLDTLATHPDFTRRGAATLLLKWGADEADKMGTECYLTSSMMARPLYEKMGFVLVRDMWFDRVPWGGEGVDWHGCMIRKPTPQGA